MPVAAKLRATPHGRQRWHGFYNEEIQFDFYRAVERFLAKHLEPDVNLGNPEGNRFSVIRAYCHQAARKLSLAIGNFGSRCD